MLLPLPRYLSIPVTGIPFLETPRLQGSQPVPKLSDPSEIFLHAAMQVDSVAAPGCSLEPMNGILPYLLTLEVALFLEHLVCPVFGRFKSAPETPFDTFWAS